MQRLGVTADSRQILFETDASRTMDLEITLGNDWVS